MDKHDVLDVLEKQIKAFSPRDSGNAIQPEIDAMIESMLHVDRPAVISALRELLSYRAHPDERTDEDARPESRLWTAAYAASHLHLIELVPDMESLLADAEEGRTLLPVYANTLRRLLEPLRVG